MEKRIGEKAHHNDIAGNRLQSAGYRRAVALLITLFFIMAITVAVGISLTQLQEGRAQLEEKQFLVQSSAILEDVLKLLEKAPEVANVTDTASLRTLFDTASLLPFEAGGLQVSVAMRSARGAMNINVLPNSKAYEEALLAYLVDHQVQDPDYLRDLLLDCMQGEQNTYLTEILDEMPWLYHEKVASMEHLQQILDFYVLMRYDSSVKQIEWEKLVRFGNRNNTQIDANYATAEVWRLLLPTLSEDQIKRLTSGEIHESEEDLDLDEEQAKQLKTFNIAYYAPVLQVGVEMAQGDQSAIIVFEYAINSKRAWEFAYEI